MSTRYLSSGILAALLAFVSLVASVHATPAAAVASREVVFIDTAVADSSALAAAVRPGVEIIMLDPQRDEFEQMSAALRGRRGLKAVHIISHGMPGAILLGNFRLDAGAVAVRDFSVLRAALAPDADLMIYGCEVANGSAGAKFVATLAAETGARVAASINTTGSAKKEGDWVLEFATGRVSTVSAIFDGTKYEGVLAAPKVVNDTNVNSIPQGNIYVRPGGISYTWTYGQGGSPLASITQASYHEVNVLPAGATPGPEDEVLTIGKFQYSTNGGSTWSDYSVGAFTPNQNSFTTNFVPVTGTIWRFVHNNASLTTTTNMLGWAYYVQGFGSSWGTSMTIVPDNAPTDITASTTQRDVLAPSAPGTALMTLTPVDTGLKTGGAWVLDSQTVANLFTLTSDTSTGNTATLGIGSGTLPSDGQTASVTVRYCDLFQTDSSGVQISGQGVSKTYTYTFHSATSTALAAFGPDISVNTTTAGSQDSPAIARLTTGDFVCVWSSANQSDPGFNSIIAQVFSPTGAKIGGEIVVSPANNGASEYYPVVTAISGGRFVVAYYSSVDADDGDTRYVLVAADGTPGAEQIANAATDRYEDALAITTLSDGSFMIGWLSYDSSYASSDILGRKFSATDGTPLVGAAGNEFTVVSSGSSPDSFVYTPALTALSGAGYAATWVQTDGTYLRVNSGTPVKLTADTNGAKLTTLSGGGFVAVWGGADTDIHFQRFDSAGSALGTVTTANTSTGSQSVPAVAAQTSNGFIVVWQSDIGDYDSNGIFGRRYDSTGTAVDGAEFEINEYRKGDQNSPAVAALAGSSFATVWTDNTADGASNSGIEVRVLSGNAAPTFVGSTTTLSVAQNASATDITNLLHVSDSDSGQTLTWSQSSGPTHGSLNFTGATASTGGADIAPGGAITYTPTSGYSGNDSFIVQVSDSVATATRTISVVVCTAPGAPTIGTATAGDAQASVTFTAPVSNGGAAITGFTVTSSPGGITGTGSASPITVTGLTNGTAYTFTVTATNAVSLTGSPSAASNSVTPMAAQTITFANPGAQNFGTTPTLTATASSGLTVTFTSDDTSVATITSGGVLTFVSTGTAKIRASQAGNSAYSAAPDVVQNFTVNAVAPGAPTIGTATAGNAQTSVAFTAPAFTGGTAITSYTVTSSPGGITGTGSASPITVTGLTNGTAYTFTVKATNAASLTGSASSASNSVTPQGTTTTTVASSLNPSTYGVSVTFTATVTPSTATGTVTFKDGSTILGTGTLSGGTATLSTSSLSVSSHAITAVYGGDAAYGSSTSGALSQIVNLASTTTTVASNLNPSTYGASVTLTSTVTPSTATGTVTFKDGGTTMGTATLSGGTATYSTSALTAGSHSLSAVYGGDTNYATSTSSTLTQTVDAVAPGAPTIGTATAGDAQASVTFMAPVSNGGAAITGYTVTSSPGGVTGTGSASPITVTGLTNGTAYTFTVTATNGASLTGSPSAASNSVTPMAAQMITFANPGAQNFGTTPTITATASSGLPVTFASDDTAVATITSGGALTFVSTGTAKIRASQAGNSAYSAAPDVVQNFTVNAVAPGAPTIGTATAGNAQASVAFTAPAFNGGAAITGYTVTSSPGGTTGTGSASPITVTGLTNGTAYTFTVKATNAASLTSSASSASNSVTPAAIVISPATLPDAVLGVAYSQTITASGGTSPYTYGVTGALPAGLTLSSSGALTGTPTALGTFSFTLTATDANGTTKASTYTLTARAKPVVITSGGATVFTEGDNVISIPVAIDSTLTVSDADSATLTSGTISITGNFDAEDVLAFANDSATMGNISGSYNSTTGVLTLTSAGPTATPAQWQAALRSVTYTNQSDSPTAADRTIGFAVNDGIYASDVATKTVNVVPTDDTPTLVTLSNAAITQSAGANAVVGTLSTTDVDSTVFTYTLVSGSGSTNNSLFNLSGANLRANNAASLAGGMYSIRVQSDDGAGGLRQQSFIITVTDDVAPVAPTLTTASGITANAKPAINGAAEPLSTVRIYDGSLLLGSATADGTGVWSYTPGTALTDGAHALTAKATDLSGNTSPASAAITLTIDTQAPAAPVITTASGNTTLKNPRIAGTAESLSTIKLYEGSALLGTVTVDGAGAWGLVLSAALAEGTHTITATATDAAGNVSATSSSCTLIVGTAPAITLAPTDKVVTVGSSATFTVTATGTATLSYQWQRSVDGTIYTNVSNGSAASYSLTGITVANTGYYRIVVSNSFGTISSTAAYLSVTPSFTAAKPDGYAAATTGDAAGSSVVVLNAADFIAQATSPNAATITIVGQLAIGTVNVGSNKTIQGADANAALVGNLKLDGVSNVIIRGLHLSNPGTTVVSGAYTDGGDALTIIGSSKVFVTHCTFFDCADHDIKIISGSDNVTVSWCEFYATAATLLHRYSVQIGTGTDSQIQHVTLHHNWWTSYLDQRMPYASYGYVHQYNNYTNTSGNTAGSTVADQAQLLSERNVFAGIANPLAKTSATTAKVRAIGNLYTGCTGTTDAGVDPVFTPNYSYEMLPASDVATEIQAKAGNTNGAGYTDIATATASITGPSAAVTRNTAFTLTAVQSGFTASSYQWRLNNVDIAGATNATYAVASAQADASAAGTYTVAVTMSSGDTVVSTPFTVTIDATAKLGSVGASGGGAPSWFYLAALVVLLGTNCMVRCAARSKHEQTRLR